MSVPKILIVDDEPFNVDYLEQEIADLEYDTASAVNGQDALDQVETEAPDLILLDIMMPILDGFGVLERLKANPVTRDIPVIIISANHDLPSVVRGIQLGAEDYLPKPFEPVLLQARITSSLEKKRLRDLQRLYLKGLERELDIARRIQTGFLPAELPQVTGWELAVYFKAAREVSGDFYDAFLLPDGNLAFVIGDVCDKGVGAALFMTLFRSLIRATATSDLSWRGEKLDSLQPAQRLAHVISFTNAYVVENHGDANMFATIFIGILNPLENTLAYINCGNVPPLVLKKGKVLTALPPSGPVVGIIPEAKFTVREITLLEDDLVLAFTDGIPDSKNADNDFFGSDRLASILDGCDEHPAALLASIETRLRQFTGDAQQFDDITLLAIQRQG